MAFILKQNDTRPVYLATLKENVGLPGEADVDLTSAQTVRFLMRSSEDSDPDPLKVDGVMDIVDAPNGIVSYEWIAADTDTVGTFNVEIEVEWNDGGIETFPNSGYGEVQITEDLD